MKKGINLRTFSVYISVLCVVVLSTRSYGADYRFEACGPRNCGNGPNVSFPFYIQGVQESYCGYAYPGFILNCSTNGYPVLHLGETEYVIEDIFYETQSFRVHNPAFFNSDNSNCLPRFRNTTLLKPQFDFAGNVTDLHWFSNCTGSSSEEMSFCDGSRALALYDGDDSVGNAKENCRTNLVAPVENGDMDIGNLVQVLRKGFVINWKASDCSVCRNSGGHCGFNETAHLFRCFCPDRPHSGSCKPELVAGKSRKKLILATAISAGGVFLLLSLSISLMIRRCKKKLDMSSDTFSKSDMELGSFHFNIPIFSYKELVVATKNFDSSSELGDGGFGTVYYGKLRDGREVAVKRLYERNCKRVEQFMNEINILTNLRHKNLVSLYGCTNKRSKELLLVYEYVSNGTVADHLHGERAEKSPLTWPIRMKIAIETASSLAYLHKSDIIHRDVKTNNILLDSNFCVKVADFGLSRLFPTDVTHVSTVPQGTPGYVDPDYHQCYQLNSKSDVYSFGVVLIELISSMPAVDINRHNSEINLANLAVNRILRQAFDELIDPSLGYGSDDDITRTTILVAELAFRCLQLEKDMRPSMDEILGFLKEIQGGDEFDLETRKSGYDDVPGAGRIPASPETDDSVLLKSKKFQASPNAVTDRWISSSSTTSSYHKSVEI